MGGSDSKETKDNSKKTKIINRNLRVLKNRGWNRILRKK